MDSETTEMQAQLVLLKEENVELKSELKNLKNLNPYFAYTVAEGETLWNISEQYLGDGQFYKDLAHLNRLDNPDSIQAGEKILFPVNEMPAE